jgi:hypothetical protein
VETDHAKRSFVFTPESASPVLKTTLTIVLDYELDPAQTAQDFTVKIKGQTGSETKDLYVMSLDGQSLQVKFPGAHSGIYSLIVDDSIHGRILSDQ